MIDASKVMEIAADAEVPQELSSPRGTAMTKTEKPSVEDRARELLNTVCRERGFVPWGASNTRRNNVSVEALCRALEAADRAEVENVELRKLLRWAHDTLKEINPSNYDHDDVCDLNSASVEVILGIAPALGETHGHPPEWWAARDIPTLTTERDAARSELADLQQQVEDYRCKMNDLFGKEWGSITRAVFEETYHRHFSPPPDPLVAAWSEAWPGTPRKDAESEAAKLRKVLDSRGIELTVKGEGK